MYQSKNSNIIKPKNQIDKIQIHGDFLLNDKTSTHIHHHKNKILGRKKKGSKEKKSHTKMTPDNIRTKIKGWFFSYICNIISFFINEYIKLDNIKYPKKIDLNMIKGKTNNMKIKDNLIFIEQSIECYLLSHLNLNKIKNFNLTNMLNSIKEKSEVFENLMNLSVKDFYLEFFLKGNNILGPLGGEYEKLFQCDWFEEKIKQVKEEEEYVDKLRDNSNLIDYFESKGNFLKNKEDYNI